MDQTLMALRELEAALPEFAEDLATLESLAGVDIPSSLNKIRCITEKALFQLCTRKGVSWGEAEPTLERMIGPLVAARCVPKNVAVHVRTIQANTSPGSHYQESPLSSSHLNIARAALADLLRWYQVQAKRRPRPAKQVKPSRPDADLAAVQNPYEFDTTATDQTFKGRREEIWDLLDSIESGTHTAVFGLQRVGKTSLIEEGLREGIKQRPNLARSVLLARIDMQGLGGDQVKYRDFLNAVIEAINGALARLHIGRDVQDLRGATHEMFAASRYQRGDRTQFFAMFAKLLRGFASAAHRQIILIIDEFSELRKVLERNKAALVQNPLRTGNLLPHDMYLDVPFIHHLGSLLKDRELKRKFTLVVLVRPFMSEYDEREELQILKLMKPITLYYLDEPAAKALITEPLQGLVGYDDGAEDYLWRLTGGHPYLLQFMLKMLVDRMRREVRRTVTLADVRAIEERMVSEGPAFDAQFEVLISDYSVAEVLHPKESLLGKGTLALIAKLGHEQPQGWVYEEQVVTGLSGHNVHVEKAAALLSQLTRTKILEESARDGRLSYRMAIPLLRKRFVRQNLYLKYFR
jgi:hypothetical protein